MEYLDILDKNGILTGKKKLRTEVHKDGDWHKAVHVWILNSKNQLLLQKRSANKDSYPNHWDISSAGHIPAGLDSLNSAIKEIKEELGIDIKKDELKYFFSTKIQIILNDGNFINNSFFDTYLLKKDLEIKNLKLRKEELSEVRWFDLNELEKEISNHNPNFAPHPDSYPKLFKKIEKIIKNKLK